MIRVLVVDDSAFMRAALSQILKADAEIEVVGTAADGVEAISEMNRSLPDVILMDVVMPKMDGISALKHIMADHPTPVLMISGVQDDPLMVFTALESGAVDFIAKPQGTISYGIAAISDELIVKVKLASRADVRKLSITGAHAKKVFALPAPFRRKELIVIGASTGGPRAISSIISGLPAGMLTSVVIAQHLTPEFSVGFARRLQSLTGLSVSIPVAGQKFLPGNIYVALGGSNTRLKTETEELGEISFDVVMDPDLHHFTPSIDLMMQSAAKIFGPALLGVILTGVGNDGVDGLRAIKEAGGDTIAEDKSTCVIYGMPKAAIAAGCVDQVLPLDLIPSAIQEMAEIRPLGLLGTIHV